MVVAFINILAPGAAFIRGWHLFEEIRFRCLWQLLQSGPCLYAGNHFTDAELSEL